MIVLVLSSACCYPGLAAFDEQAKKVIEQAIEETGVEAEIKIIPGTSALYSGAVPKRVMKDLMKRLSRNETGPAVLINGEVVSYGVPRLEDMKTTLKKVEELNKSQQ
jgi:hypothetical protein